MAYTPPFIDATGLHLPVYQDVIDLYTSNFQSIYGPGVYLGNDSADFQLLSIFALAISDSYAAAQLDFNNHSPNFAIGPALDSVVKINGLARKIASFSTCTVTVSGAPGTTINSGVVRDSVPQQGFLWSLPSSVTIPMGGSIDTIATCQVIGTVNALSGQLNIISSPVAGWNSVINAAAANLGQPVETDSQLRTRQAISTELPSITMLAGTIAGIAALLGVTRYNVDENPTNVTNANGNPPHSITAVVEGGDTGAIAQAIYNNKGIGCYTNGTVVVVVTDPNSGTVQNVRFDRPAYVPIFVTLNVHALPGFTTATQTAIQAAIVEYLNDLQIGELVTLSAMYAVAMSVTPNIEVPTFSVRSVFLDISASPSSTADIILTFTQVAQGVTANVVVNLV